MERHKVHQAPLRNQAPATRNVKVMAALLHAHGSLACLWHTGPCALICTCHGRHTSCSDPMQPCLCREDLGAHLLSLGQRLSSLRSCLETLQDVLGLDGTLLWQQAFSHVLQVSSCRMHCRMSWA